MFTNIVFAFSLSLSLLILKYDRDEHTLLDILTRFHTSDALVRLKVWSRGCTLTRNWELQPQARFPREPQTERRMFIDRKKWLWKAFLAGGRRGQIDAAGPEKSTVKIFHWGWFSAVGGLFLGLSPYAAQTRYQSASVRIVGATNRRPATGNFVFPRDRNRPVHLLRT